jgi:hypothetical protein
MTASEFEKELKELDPRFTVVDNPNRPGLSNIFFEGRNYDLPAISSYNIKDEVDHAYRYEFPNGMTARFHTRPEVLTKLEDFLKNLDTIREDYE